MAVKVRTASHELTPSTLVHVVDDSQMAAAIEMPSVPAESGGAGTAVAD
jgi:hypothetical protein